MLKLIFVFFVLINFLPPLAYRYEWASYLSNKLYLTKALHYFHLANDSWSYFSGSSPLGGSSVKRTRPLTIFVNNSKISIETKSIHMVFPFNSLTSTRLYSSYPNVFLSFNDRKRKLDVVERWLCTYNILSEGGQIIAIKGNFTDDYVASLYENFSRYETYESKEFVYAMYECDY